MSRSSDPLRNLKVASPCPANWDGMYGDERVRFCGDCRQSVYNVAMFTRAEATRLLNDSSGRVCLRIFRRPDGTVVTDDCRARLRAARKRGLLIFAGTLVVVFWAQICAQFVGFMGLRRVMSSGGTMGEPPTMPMAGAPVPLPPPAPIEMTGEPPLLEMKGEAPPPVHRLMGKPSIKGKVIVNKDAAR